MSVINVDVAVMNALGPETIPVRLDAILQASVDELTRSITERVPLARFPQPRPWPKEILEVAVPRGAYSAARATISTILKDIYRQKA